MQDALNSYISKCYLNENSAAGVFIKDDGKLDIIITGEKTNLKNFWSGRWNSSWCVDLDNSQTICGDIKVWKLRI